MSDIFQEVDEEVRRDKAAEFWKKYQNQIIAAAAVLVLATAGFRFWGYQQQKAAQAAGDQFQQAIAAFEAGKLDEAKGALAGIVAKSPGGYGLLAQMAEAGAKAKSDPRGAIAAFDAVAGDASVDPLFREAARLRAALIRLDTPSDEQRGAAELTSIAGAGGPFRRLARLSLGAVALSRGEYDEAAKQLDQLLSDPEVLPGERQLAERWLGLVASNKTPAK